MHYTDYPSAAMDHQDFLCYISDPETYELLYVNKNIKDSFGSAPDSEYLGKKCYAVLQGKDAPCEFCTNGQLCLGERVQWEYYNPLLGRYFSLTDSFISVNGRTVRMEIALDISDHYEKVSSLEMKLSTEETLVRCVEALNAHDETEDAIDKIMSIIAQYYQCDRVYIFEFHPSEDTFSNIFEWCNDPAIAQIDTLQNIPMENVAGWVSEFEAHGHVCICSLEDDVPHDSTTYEILSRQGIHSLLAVPLFVDNQTTGFIGIDNPTQHNDNLALLSSTSVFIWDDLHKRRLRSRLEYLSYVDALTGLYNRHKYIEQIAAFEKSLPQKIGVAYIDINGLKNINELYGHLHGDYIIQKTAKVLDQHFSNRVYRISGDEFVVLWPDVSESAFEGVLYALREHLANDSEISLSVGSVWKIDDIDISREINYADEIMHAEKQNYYKLAQTQRASHKAHAAHDLLAEIERGAFCVYLQGKVELATGKISGAEALIRKFDEQGNPISPVKFVPAYEYDRIIRHIDFFVLETLCRTMRDWIDAGHPLKISLNFSRVTLMEHDVVEKIAAMCQKYDVPTAWFDVEITESIDNMANDLLERKIAALKEAGFSVSLDDFGAQYSNLLMLSSINFSEVKIDKSLIDDLPTNPKSQVVVQHSIEMVNAFGTTSTLAEGIETQAQLDLLRAYGCKHGQGYFFLRPMPIAQFLEKYLAQRD